MQRTVIAIARERNRQAMENAAKNDGTILSTSTDAEELEPIIKKALNIDWDMKIIGKEICGE